MQRLIVISTFFISLLVNGQQYSFINYNVDEGLAQSQAMVLHQDRKGYLWVGTVSGLSRFDGSEFLNFSKADGLFDNNIKCIAGSQSGELYFGCQGGFSVWNGVGFRSYALPERFSAHQVVSMNWLEDGQMWLGTDGSGYMYFDTANETFSEPNKKSGGYVRWLSSEIDAFVASEQGFFLDDELVASVLEGVTINDAAIKDGKIYLSTVSSGFFVIDEHWTRFTEEDGLLSDRIRKFHLGTDGSCWLATRHGVSRLKDGQVTNFTEDNGLPYNNIRDVLEDNEGNIWLASNGQGIFRFTGNTFKTYKEGKELLNDQVLSLASVQGKMLLGTFDKGLQAYDVINGSGMVDGIPKTDVWSLLECKDGRVWAGTSRGLYLIEGQEVTSFRTENGLGSNRITSLYEDASGLVWVGHRAGLSVFNGTEFVNLDEESGFGGKRVRAICQGEDGTMWFGAENGLFAFNNESFTRYTEGDGLSDNTVYSLACDGEGRIWLGTNNGLNLLDKGELSDKEFSEGLDRKGVNFLHISNGDQLLIGTNFGLYRLDLNSLEGGTPRFHHYGTSSGLPSLECNLNSVYQTDNGDIWFGTNNGLVRCKETDLMADRDHMVAHPQIKNIRLFGQSFDWTKKSKSMDISNGLPKGLCFEHSENHLTFDFNSIAFKNPGRMKYSYYLEGVDEEWIAPTSISTVSYSALAPGDYEFKVRSYNDAGIASNKIVALTFSILPPFYLTWWFILIELLALAGVVSLIWKWRLQVRQRKRENQELSLRTRMFSLEQQSLNSSMNRHFIFNALNSIQYYINREDKRSANRYLSSFAKLIRKNLDSTSSTWVTLKDELERLDLYLGLEHMRFRDKFDYEIRIQEKLNSSGVQVPSMMLQPFLENSIWHGILPKKEKGMVLVEVRESEGLVHIIIEDDGIGIVESQKEKSSRKSDHTSRGVDITNDRIQLYKKMTNEDFEILGPLQMEENGVVTGTRVEIQIPLMPLSEVKEMEEKKFESTLL